MRFYVVDPTSAEWQSAPVEVEPFVAVRDLENVAWLPFPRSADPTQLDFYVSNVPSFVQRSDAFLIGLPPNAAAYIDRNPRILEDVAQRIEGVPLYLVRHDRGQPALVHHSGEIIQGLGANSSLEHIKQLDVAEVLRRPGSELPKHPGFHYEGPNGDHYEAFLRPGFALRSIEELDRVAFWLVPMLGGRRRLLVDHWSMIAIGYHLGRYALEMGETGEILVESLKSYTEDVDVLSRRLTDAFPHSSEEDGAILVSVNSSGRLVRDTLIPAMERAGFDSPATFSLAKTPSPQEFEIQALTTLSDDFSRQDPEECRACSNDGSALIPIQQDSYLLSLAAYTHNTQITRDLAQDGKEVVERYSGKSVFWIHRTHSDGRHHSYYIDLLPILDNAVFRQRLDEALSTLRDKHFDLLIHPSHQAARRLARDVADRLGVTKLIECDERNLPLLEGDDRQSIFEAKRVCLVDDVVITGSRLFGYRNTLNRIRRARNIEPSELFCVTGFARPRSEKALIAISDVLHHQNSDPRFIFVEKLFLPNWDEKDCRWCAELRSLDNLPDEVKDRPLIRNRLETLRNPSGMTDNLFLPWLDEGDLQEHQVGFDWPESHDENGLQYDYWELGPKSVFGDVQGADLATSVAAAMQRMRGRRRNDQGQWLESELDEVFHSPVAKVMDPQLYLAGRYYEPVLVACILRASKRHDLRAPGDDFNLNKRLEVLAAADSSIQLHGELMLARLINQLPPIPKELIPDPHPDLDAFVKTVLGFD